MLRECGLVANRANQRAATASPEARSTRPITATLGAIFLQILTTFLL
jgi:hypothetical protein